MFFKKLILVVVPCVSGFVSLAFITRIYHDARSSECQILDLTFS